ncbi:MAG: DUF4173 domain-containing protein [Bacteroidales bacterium]|jgi:Leucine-rich repeat (LRR) protein|nr:DUF4173 domain-containing protein [Bacteroidales bacterium]MDD4213426.1 DUF4173 domain-containing protein [Bacteroidales bacterium]
MKKNDFLLIISVALYSALFYRQSPGINFMLFSFALIILLLIRNKTLIKNTYWYVAAAGSIVSGVCVMLYGTWLAFFANMVSLSLISALSISKNSSVLLAGIYALYSYVSSIGFMIVDFIERRSTKNKPMGSKFWIKLSIGVGIFAVIVLFFFLYQQSNPLFKDLTRKINLDFISWPWVRFTFLGFLILYGFFYHRNFPAIYRWDVNIPENLQQSNYEEKGNIFFGKKLNETLERRSGVILLALLNVLLLVVNVLDVVYLWITRQLPEGMTLAESLHQGTGTLIVSIVLAIIIILFYFRGCLNFSDKNKYIKWLAYVWILQNVFVLVSTGYRNLLYISEYSLTYKRLGVYVWLLLTILGLITTFYKLWRKKSNLYLFKANSLVVYLVLVLFACFNWDQVITRFNIKYSKSVDKNYLVELKSPASLPDLLTMPPDEFDFTKEAFDLQNDYNYYSSYYYDKLFYRGNYTAKLHKRLYDFLNNLSNVDWRSWNLAASRTEKEIYRLSDEGKIAKLLLRKQKITNLKALKNLKTLEYINVAENQIKDLTPLSVMDKLVFLDVSQNGIYNLDSLSYIPNLKQLILSNNYINDFTKLKDFKTLTELNISENSGIIDISPLASLDKLTSLDISSNEIINAESLKSLINLKNLNISSMKNSETIKNLPVLAGLEEINLSKNNFKLDDISLIEKFKEFKNLKTIDISGNNLKNLYLLTDVKNPAFSLFFGWAEEKNAQPIFASLVKLTAASNAIRNLEALAYYPQLKYLDLSHNSLNSTETLKMLTELETLNLSNTSFVNFDDISKLSKLKTLNISSNMIPDISAMTLPAIEELDLSKNQLVNIERLTQMKNLKKLNLSQNLIYDISPILYLKKLETLDISTNSVSDYEVLYKMKQLKELKVSNITLDTYNSLKENLPNTRIIASQISKRSSK